MVHARALVSLFLAPSLLAPGPASADAPRAVLVLSRHSGQVTAGQDFPLPRSKAIDALANELAISERSARALADAVRIRAELGRWDRRTVDGLAIEADADRVQIADGSVPLPDYNRDDAPVEVQVFGLVGSERVSILCTGRAVRVEGGRSEDLSSGWQTLRTALRNGASLCAGRPWSVRVAGSEPRPYAGVFSFRPLPERQPETGTTRREARARRGSEVIFRTTLASYVAGVLAAEHAGLTGEVAVALARVIAHDAHVERHARRPLCDTTHCQAFLGTAAPTPEVTRALALPELATRDWLPYFRGGDEPWEVRRSRAEVRAALGDAQRLQGDGRTVEVTRAAGVERLPCERVRAALRLPGCPIDGVFQEETVRLSGRGRGHGLGLDVEAARRSGLTAEDLLRRAYGFDP
ncbi:MAG TPA: SpoIID/LytB domain-containing protein [Myxococcaceae bacterium]|nr:SpoIID/LytB domain-containing protein [Myxococcaceae bacterium]